MSANNFWDNFSHGFMHGMFNSNPFFGCNMFYPGFNLFGGCGGFGNFWGGGCFNSLFMYPSMMNTFTLYPTINNNNFPPMPNVNFDFDFKFDNIFDKQTQNNSELDFNNITQETPRFFDPNFLMGNSGTITNSSFTPNIPDFTLGDYFQKTTSVPKSSPTSAGSRKNETKKPAATLTRQDGDYTKMLSFILKAEGNDEAITVKGDRGGRTKKGVTQKTYDGYRKQKGLPTQKVDNMTESEMQDIYYNNFYKPSGADKISDPRLAFYVFDTATNMGVGPAKKLLEQSGGDPDKFIELRRNRYNSIVANDSSQRKFLKGWNNRLKNMQAYANSELV